MIHSTDSTADNFVLIFLCRLNCSLNCYFVCLSCVFIDCGSCMISNWVSLGVYQMHPHSTHTYAHTRTHTHTHTHSHSHSHTHTHARTRARACVDLTRWWSFVFAIFWSFCEYCLKLKTESLNFNAAVYVFLLWFWMRIWSLSHLCPCWTAHP